MPQKVINSLFILALVATLVALGTRPAVGMQEEEEGKKTEIVIKSVDENGEERVRRHRVFINEDGDVHEMEGAGAHFKWKGDGGHHMRFAVPDFDFDFGSGGFLGVSTTPLSPELRAHFGAPEDAGVMISQIVEDSAAFRAGLLVGDIITAVDGESIDSSMALLHSIRAREEGESVTVDLLRDGRAERLVATLDERQSRFPGMRHLSRALRFDCGDEDDCDVIVGHHGSELCDGDDCEVRISCDEGECTCLVNGEETDCEGVEGVHVIEHD